MNTETTDPTTDTTTVTSIDDNSPETVADEDKGKAGREAAKYRTQLRETEAERDTLRERVATMQRSEVERIAGKTVAKPAGLWAAGTKLEDLLDDSGQVEEKKVTEAIKAAADALGLSRTPPPGIAPLQGTSQQYKPKAQDFTSAFGPGRDD